VMRYLSVCSGIEAATAAWHSLGWEAAAFSEIEAFPRAVLTHHCPDTPLHGDFTTIGADEYGAIDLLVGGTPCQSFSVAGLRGGLADERGNLALEYLRLADRARPRWLVWENVPGVLSSNGGRDFGTFLGGLAQLGYGWAYRVLDAQFFGVPQRRRRVFVVGHLGDWRRAAAVLFERHSLSGHPAPRREKGQAASRSFGFGSHASSDGEATNSSHAAGGPVGFGLVEEATPALRAGRTQAIASTGEISHCLNAGGMGRQDYETETPIAHSLRAEGFDASEDGTGRGTPLVPVAFAQNSRDEVREIGGNIAGALAAEPGMKQQTYVAFTCSEQANSFAWERDVYPTLNAQIPNDSSNIQQGVRLGSAVRRLTPRECERLQGFPDDFTLVPYRGRMMADGPRYKALGNSMAVPVLKWIGERIELVEALAAQAKAA
jgi:DNA (cytosine-5)-methyltransferase 1